MIVAVSFRCKTRHNLVQVQIPVGVFVVFAGARAAAILYTDLHWFRVQIPSATDIPNTQIFSEISRCLRHVLTKVEEIIVNDDTYDLT